MLSAKSLTIIWSFVTKIIAVQTSIRKSDLVSSDSSESQIRKTSGKGNSCESINVSHLRKCEKYLKKEKSEDIVQSFFEPTTLQGVSSQTDFFHHYFINLIF